MGFIINPYQVQPGVPAFTGILDTYTGAAVGFSAARRLSSSYTGALIRVRRSSDNTEQDIGYNVSNVLDESALTSFVGSGNGFVTRWYDQSGNGNNLTQSTAANQPKIVNSGSIIKRNSKPFIESTSSQYLQLNSDLVAAINTNYSYWMTYEKDSTSNQAILLKDNNSYHWLDYGTTQYITNINSITISSSFSANTLYLTNVITDFSVSSAMYRNNTSIGTSGALGYPASTAFIPSNQFRSATITCSEFIYYASNKESDRTGIAGNINTFYSIY